MITLDRIYTKGGDKGETSLGDGTRRSKHDARVDCYGNVDELNVVLGIVIAEKKLSAEITKLLSIIQNDLFDMGADLCRPSKKDDKALRITELQIDRLEQEIDRFNEKLEPLKSFILPGGCRASAGLHLARVVARRAERSCSALCQKESINPMVLTYLNRLSDLFFVLARVENNEGRDDVLWNPGAYR